MTTENTYNGWTNYATWRVNLELCDEYCNSLVTDDYRFDSIAELADRLSEMVDDAICGYDSLEGIAVDYARSFVSDVNWHEIAEHWTDELIEADTDAA
jgi:hypothetical protein